jgi:hypothetical protein
MMPLTSYPMRVVSYSEAHNSIKSVLDIAAKVSKLSQAGNRLMVTNMMAIACIVAARLQLLNKNNFL